MDPLPALHRRRSDDLAPGRTPYFDPRNRSNESLETPSNRPPSPKPNDRQPPSSNDISDEEIEIQYGGEPIPTRRVSQSPRRVLKSPRRVRQASRSTNASSRTRPFISDEYINGLSGTSEGLETDRRKAEEVEEAGLSRTVTLPSDNDHSRLYTNLAEPNSVWRAEKTCDRRVGMTTLQSIYSIQYSIGDKGQPKVTLFCPQGPARHDDDVSSVQARWLHIQRPSMSIRVLEKLVMDCPLINGDIRRVALLLLEAVEGTFLRQSEHGAYVEPGSALRFVGHRHQLHDSYSIVVTDPVVFVAFPFVELASSKNHHGSDERDEYHPRTLLQNLYGFDVVTSRGKQQVIHKMSVGSQSSDTLYVNQLWCLLIGSDILITMSGRPEDDLLGETIEKRTDYFRQPLRIEIVDRHGSQYSMTISLKTTWVDFFRHVMFTVHGNLTQIMDYELVDESNDTVTAERWVEIAKSTRPGLLKFHLVKRRIVTSRASSISSRRSSRTGIRKLLMLDQALRVKSRDSSRRHRDSYDKDSTSDEKPATSKPKRPGPQQYRAPLFDTHTLKQPAEEKEGQDGTQGKRYPQADIPGHGPQSGPTVITLDGSDEKESANEEKSSAMRYPQHVDERVQEQNTSAEDASFRHDAFAPVLQKIAPLDAGDADNDNQFPSADDHSLNHDQQPPEGDAEEANTIDIRASIMQAKKESSHLQHGNEQGNFEEASERAIHPSPIKDSTNSAQGLGIEFSEDDSTRYIDRSVPQLTKPASSYRRVTIEDESDTEPSDTEPDDTDSHANNSPTRESLLYEIIEADFGDGEVINSEAEYANQPSSQNQWTRANTPHERDRWIYDRETLPRSPSRRLRSRSRSPSSSSDDSFRSRGRSLTKRRRVRRQHDTHSSRGSSSRLGVRFDSHSRYSNGRESLEMSPYGSSNATKVEASAGKAVVVPFLCWKQNSVAGADSSSDMTDQRLIKLLDHIDELMSDHPVGKYYLKVAEFTMDDVLSRHERLDEAVLESGWSKGLDETSMLGHAGCQQGDNSTADGNLFKRLSDSQAGTADKASCEDKHDGVEGLGVKSKDPPTAGPEVVGEDSFPHQESISNILDGTCQEKTQFSQTQALGLTSHDKTLVKQLVEVSQQIIWSFIPNTGGSVIHTLLKRFWGCVDIICLQLTWEENQRGHDAERTYIIRNFTSQVKGYNLERRKPSLGKVHYLDCEDCKAEKPYSSAESALEHLHEKHLECSHGTSNRPYDDPCGAWLHRIWPDGYPMRSSQDGLLGVVEDFLDELSDISGYVTELLNMTARDSVTGDTPPLSVNIIHIFQQIVKVFVFRSKQLSLVNRSRSLAAEGPLEDLRLIQRIDRKIEELLSLEMDTNERIIDLSESAKKDIFMSGIGSHSEMPQAETVRVQFLALALMSGIQRPLLQPAYTRRSYTKDTLLQLYKDYTSRLHFQANNRPRKRVFLDIHGLEEELQALDKLLGSQESCLYNVLTLIDPLTSRYTTETRLREFRAELQYGNDQLRGIINRRREIENLATRLRILKDQVKQTIEIMEEDHGKAIRVFTVVTLFFLPLSFVSSFLGMNTVDVRDTEYSQRIFWMTGVPVTVAVLAVAFVYGYKGEEIRDWMAHVLQDRRHQNPSLSENRDTGYRTSLETGWREWTTVTAAKPTTLHRRRLTTLMRGKIGDAPDQPPSRLDNLEMDNPDGKFWIERRETDDSLAPIRRRM
ncbi:hypothetical protein J3F83DRAFT_744819 [Trichoderma novae-zelandiae]